MTKKEFAAALDSALKAVRKEYGFTQEKMAAVLGISKKTLVEIEKGRSSLGWTGAAAFAAIFRESFILQAQFGGDLDDLVEALAFAEAEPQYPKTMGGRVWWRHRRNPSKRGSSLLRTMRGRILRRARLLRRAASG